MEVSLYDEPISFFIFKSSKNMAADYFLVKRTFNFEGRFFMGVLRLMCFLWIMCACIQGVFFYVMASYKELLVISAESFFFKDNQVYNGILFLRTSFPLIRKQIISWKSLSKPNSLDISIKDPGQTLK
ncbi:hypothetical protein D0469_11325 [Peribacillus saganii]|uniref:Uncharacterized protein n=1 Tax=Peribacillus saganii TaxID=2303992 RepID=A0A372LNY2_9BACI|nr:hypothetical protein D0469_11325 [Peribacillus saganii]